MHLLDVCRLPLLIVLIILRPGIFSKELKLLTNSTIRPYSFLMSRSILSERLPQALNTRLVITRQPLEAPHIMSENGKPLPASLYPNARHKLRTFRQYFTAMKGMNYSSVASLQPESWPSLAMDTYGVMQDYITHIPDALASPKQKMSLAHAGLAACAVVGAFLEAGTHAVLREFPYATTELVARHLARSSGTLMAIAASHVDTDRDLTYGLTTRPKPKLHTSGPEQIYADLHFQPKYFNVSDGRIDVRQNSLVTMRNPEGKPITLHPNPNTTLFGCPLRARIPRLYAGMLTAAVDSSLVERTVEHHRGV